MGEVELSGERRGTPGRAELVPLVLVPASCARGPGPVVDRASGPHQILSWKRTEEEKVKSVGTGKGKTDGSRDT